ncbi:unnamed protein product, partial [Amoebophrya sp. A120]
PISKKRFRGTRKPARAITAQDFMKQVDAIRKASIGTQMKDFDDRLRAYIFGLSSSVLKSFLSDTSLSFNLQKREQHVLFDLLKTKLAPDEKVKPKKNGINIQCFFPNKVMECLKIESALADANKAFPLAGSRPMLVYKYPPPCRWIYSYTKTCRSSTLDKWTNINSLPCFCKRNEFSKYRSIPGSTDLREHVITGDSSILCEPALNIDASPEEVSRLAEIVSRGAKFRFPDEEFSQPEDVVEKCIRSLSSALETCKTKLIEKNKKSITNEKVKEVDAWASQILEKARSNTG